MHDLLQAAYKFSDYLKADSDVDKIILDGSVNNREDIWLFSDIDIKVFTNSCAILQSTYNSIVDSIKKCQEEEPKAIFNVWTLTSMEYPKSTDSSLFDFVRRYCLITGNYLYGSPGNDTESLQLVAERNDLLVCARAMLSFQIRLRRLLTNPNAITDVNHPSPWFYYQQGISYLFHALRYYLAAKGVVIKKISDIYKYCLSDDDLSNQISLISHAFQKRQNWSSADLYRNDLLESQRFLHDSIDCIGHLQRILDSMLLDSQGNCIIKLKYC